MVNAYHQHVLGDRTITKTITTKCHFKGIVSHRIEVWHMYLHLSHEKKQLITFHYTGCYGCSIGILIIVYHNPYITGQYNRYNRLYSLNNQFFFVAHLVEFMVHVGPCLQTVWIVKAIRVTHFLPGLFGQFRPLNRHGRGSNFPTNFTTSSVKGSMRIPVQFMPCSKA